MEYSIRQLADLAGISTRTLRYYDEVKLVYMRLNPSYSIRIMMNLKRWKIIIISFSNKKMNWS